ncbi:unnamed protein product [Microthlaspi erraticum]|uniref:Terpene synthase metal-binding domain-containing protein n=1 Tax=Microthlaspi erraticum TaxID=1685480 RepID=A0A6D2JEJ6_9BRAS|nr:unnamed protein product [Microthlaspi erraticum]
MEAITSFGPTFGSQFSLRSRTNSTWESKLSRSLRTSSKPGKLVRLKATPPTHTFVDPESSRTSVRPHTNSAYLSPSQWGDLFLSLSDDVSEMNALERDFETLKSKVRETFMSRSQGIEESKTRVDDMMIGEDDLYKVSIIFWVFRTYGHNMSSDVFKRFQGNNGKFKESLVGNVKGMLSLYEAAHLGTRTESIMDEALSFASSHLKKLSGGGNLPFHMSRQIENALHISQHRNLELVVVVEFIRFYEQEVDHDEVLLKFSKLNFNFLQLHYQQELEILTKWNKDMDFASNLPPFYRDRIVEMHFFMPAMFFEPQSSRARIMITKFYALMTIIDDTYDRYASIHDAESLTDSLERLDPDDAMDKQPDYCKFIFKFIMETFKDFESEFGSDSMKPTLEEFKALLKGSLNLAKWAQASHVPSFEDYLEIAEGEHTVCTSMAAILMGMKQIPTHEAYDWFKSKPKLVRTLGIKARLMNDIIGFKDDMDRGYVSNGINCYMNQYGVTEKEAIRELRKMITEADKILNEEILKNIIVPRRVWNVALGIARAVNFTCSASDDQYNNPKGKIKEYIISLFVKKIRL